MSRESVLVDSGFFFALYNQRDSNHAEAIEKAEWLSDLAVVIPWPILYETVNTRFARRPNLRESVGRVVLRSFDFEVPPEWPQRVLGSDIEVPPYLHLSQART